ncbi:hypothetical protein ACFRJ1_32770 [Streptomyces sp. NPDC056773]|uniref:hypothetical protein n=1 Tax=unclassified Streptomyces TaxID=2593676 RepID=UPI0020B6FBDA|nr:hypothetical protein [Streptomyces sp. TBY4]MCP3757755.1 hypothetical protein [Streptomyces sp. TBY4]
MDGIGTDEVLASRWDGAYAVGLFLRALLGSLPDWVKVTVGGLVGAVLLWEVHRWWSRRRAAVR